jgi:hypothetical protein
MSALGKKSSFFKPPSKQNMSIRLMQYIMPDSFALTNLSGSGIIALTSIRMVKR